LNLRAVLEGFAAGREGHYTYSISLRARHPTRPLGDLTTELGIVPTNSGIAGAPRTTPKGGPLSGVNREHSWIGPMLEGSADSDLAGALNTIVDRLSVKKALFKLLTANGGEVELFVGWFFNHGSRGDVFDHKLLGRLADLNIDLSFDVYP